MADNLKDIKVSQQDVKQAFDQWVKEQIDQGYSAENIKYNIEQGQKQVNDILIKKAKAIALDKYYQQAVDKMGDALVKQVAANKNQNSFSRFKSWLYTSNDKDDMASQYRARQMAGGIESILSGNFASGLRQIGSTMPRIAHFMGTGWYLALTLTYRGMLKLDEALSKVTKQVTTMTGGLQSEYVGHRWGSALLRNQLKSEIIPIGMGGQINDILSNISSNYGLAYTANKQRDLVKTIGYSQYGLKSYGIGEQSTNQLVSNLRLLEGKDQIGVYAQLKRLTDRFGTMRMFSPEQALQQATSLYDQTKHLGTNFEWASRTVKAFEYQLKKGTMTLSDFAAGNRALQSGGVSKNAGIAALLTDYASRNGISLPTAFTNSNAIGQGFALSSPAMLGSNAVAKAMSGKITEMINQMGMTTKYEKAGALQLILQSMGINVSASAAQGAIRNDGTVNLQSTGIMGGAAFKKRKDEEEDALKYENQVKTYYTNTESYQKQMKVWVEGLYNHFVTNFEKGAAEGMSTSSFDILHNIGAMFGMTFWQQFAQSFDSPYIQNMYKNGGYNGAWFNQNKQPTDGN